MEIKILLPLCLITLVSGAVHHPKVYEDQVEHNRYEYIRTVRNPQAVHKSLTNQPHIFNFRTAKQQNYLKRRYAQQQVVDLARIAAMSKNKQYIRQPVIASASSYQHSSQGQRSKKDTQGWEPFDPQLIRQNKEPVDQGTKNYTTIKNISNVDRRDVEMTPEIIEQKDKINRNDSPNMLGSVVYVQPKLFMQNSVQNRRQSALDVNAKGSEMQLTILNELIGKNPNVQLEGLKRLLEDPSTKVHVPVISGPQPFQLKDHTPISEAAVDILNPHNMPNPELDASITAQLPHIPSVIDRGSLDDLQKQFDEASKLQIEQALSRAREDAKAQVEAQHKAIALAQAEAQKAALDNFQKSFYSLANPTAAPVIQQNTLNEGKAQTSSSSDISSVAFTQPGDTQSPHFQNQVLLEQTVSSPVIPDTSNEDDTEDTLLNKEILPQTYSSKELLHYAPNHQHQNVAQFQDGSGFSLQAQAQNGAILEELTDHRQIVDADDKVSEQDVVIIHTTPQPEYIDDEVQQLKDRSRTLIKKISEEHDSDLDTLQYAAKYAFGYRVKDANEGNDFGHEERRNGKRTEGSYHVLLPDGRLQKVQYYADKSGFHAWVTYEQAGHK